MNQFTILFLAIFIYTSAISQSNKVLDKLDYSLTQLKPVKEHYESGQEEEALKSLLRLYRSKDNLYLKVSVKDVKHIKSNFPKEVENTLTTANEVLDHYFLFRDEWDMEKTNIPYKFDGEIDWKAVPNGDMEWCFMLNRHKFWIHLGKAYMLTGNEKYAEGFVKQANHWIDNNPLEEDLKKYSWRRIEAGLRLENWIKAFCLVLK